MLGASGFSKSFKCVLSSSRVSIASQIEMYGVGRNGKHNVNPTSWCSLYNSEWDQVFPFFCAPYSLCSILPVLILSKPVYNRYLNERRLNGNENQTTAGLGKRPAFEHPDDQPISGKRPRGRPKGSKNKAKTAEVAWVFLTWLLSNVAGRWTGHASTEEGDRLRVEDRISD